MLGKRSWPGIRKLSGPLRSGLVDSITSPRSPLECKMPSPRGLKNYDQGGIGLGIVVALDKSSNIISTTCGGGEILAKYAIRSQSSACSSPIPVTSSTKAKEMDMGEVLDEEITYVTCHGPNKSVTTRVYYDRGDPRGKNVTCNKIKFRGGNGPSRGVFKISPDVISDEDRSHSTYDSDFLSSCHLCRKALHGEDIYMYRGEKAFCSTECRQQQIAIDERKEQCRSELSRSNDVVSSSPYTRGQIFSTGIIAV